MVAKVTIGNSTHSIVIFTTNKYTLETDRLLEDGGMIKIDGIDNLIEKIKKVNISGIQNKKARIENSSITPLPDGFQAQIVPGDILPRRHTHWFGLKDIGKRYIEMERKKEELTIGTLVYVSLDWAAYPNSSVEFREIDEKEEVIAINGGIGEMLATIRQIYKEPSSSLYIWRA